MVSGLLDAQLLAVLSGLAMVLFLLLLRAVFRKRWLVVVLFLCLQTVGNLALMRAIFVGARPIDWLVAGGFTALTLIVLVRLGLLATMAACFVVGLLSVQYPLVTWDLSAWSSHSFLAALLFLVAMALYGLHTSLAGQPLLRNLLAEG